MPGVGSPNIDGNKRAIFKLQRTPQNILNQNDIYRSHWASGKEGITSVHQLLLGAGVGGGGQDEDLALTGPSHLSLGLSSRRAAS